MSPSPLYLPAAQLATAAPAWVQVDSVGAGQTQGAGTPVSMTYTHVIDASATAILLVVNADITTSTFPGVTAKVGSTFMTQLQGLPSFGATGGDWQSIFVFGLLSPPTGSQTITVTFSSGGTQYSAANSVSYLNVGGFGTCTAVHTAPISLLPDISSAVGQMIACGFTGIANSFTAFNGSIRSNAAYSAGTNQALLIGDVAISQNNQQPANLQATTAATLGAGIAAPIIPSSQVATAPAYDATGAGNALIGSTITWTHTATAGSFVIVAVSVYGNFSINSCLYGATLMYQLPSSIFNNIAADGCVFMFGLANVAGGSKTVTVNLSGSTTVSGNSVSYTGVGSVTNPQNVVGSTLPSQTVLSGTYSRIVQAFGWQTSTSQPATTGGTNRTVQGYSSSPNFLADLTINDAVGPATFANSLTSVNYGGVAVMLSPVQSWSPAVYFEAVATGNANTASATTSTTTWTHTTAGGSTAAVIVYLAAAMNQPYSSIACTYGGVAMTYLGGIEFFNSAGVQYFIFQFGVINPPAGASTVSATLTVTTSGTAIVMGNSVSYMNVGSFGLFGINGSTGTSLSIIDPAATGQIMLNAFSTDQTFPLSAYTKTLRSSQPTGLSTSSPPLMIGESAGSGSSTTTGNNISFGATQTSSSAWGAITLQLLPIG